MSDAAHGTVPRGTGISPVSHMGVPPMSAVSVTSAPAVSPAPPSPCRPAIVLVADRTLSADYKVLFEGIFATMQTTQTPSLIMRRLLSPRMATDADGRARSAALGLRRVEASLIARGIVSPADVICTTPERLADVLGPWVKIVAVSSSDPLGNGMSNTTTRSFCRGELYTRRWTRKMMEQIVAAKERHGFTVVAGGGGAWQYAADRQAAGSHGIDCIFEGYFEEQGPGLFADILAGRTPPPHVVEEGTATAAVQPIRGPSMMGAIELTRGCGKGCGFCASGLKRMDSLPMETILSDLAANVAGGQTAVVNGSEDFFRYGSSGGKVDFDKLHALLTAMTRVEGLSFMQIDHANVSSILQLSDEQLAEIRRLLNWRKRIDYQWLNIGVESANGLLVRANGAGKIAPFRAEDWEDMVRQAADKAVRAGFFPVLSLVLGLPGETPDDVARTQRLVDELAQKPAAMFPIFHEPLPGRGGGPAFGAEAMRADHLGLFRSCYEINFRWIPRLIWDNQRAGGVPWAKRALLQMLGRGEVLMWRHTFRKMARRIARRPSAVAGGPAA